MRQRAFDRLKRALLEAPVIRLPNVDVPFRVATDASDFAVAGVLLQQADGGKHDSVWYPVTYTSGKLTPAERN